MLDLFPQLSASGIGQQEGGATTAPLPKIDFGDIPQFVPPQQGALGGAPQIDMLNLKMDSSIFDRVEPETFANRNVRKLVNSSVFGDIGYNKNSNEEDRYDKAQPWWESTKNAGIKLGLTSWNSFTGFFKQNIDTFDSIRKMNVENSWKNEGDLEKLKEQENIENLYPNFAGKEGTHWYSFIPGLKGSGDFYEQFVPQLGYTLGTMAGAIGENLIIGALTGGVAEPLEGANTMRKIYRALSGFSNAEKAIEIAQAATKGAKIMRGLEIGANGWSMYNAAASEASMEAGQTYNQTKDTMVDQYIKKYGYAPFGEQAAKVEKLSTDAGNTDFTINVPGLMIGNAIQFRNILFPAIAKAEAMAVRLGKNVLEVEGVGAASKIVAKDVAEKTFRQAWKGATIAERTKLLASYLGNEKLAFLTEGVEEEWQRAASSGSQDYAMDQFFDPEHSSGTKSIGYGVSDMFNAQGWQEFVGGALGGLLFQGMGHMSQKFATPKEITNPTTGEKTYSYNFLNDIGIFSEKWKDQKAKEYAQKLADTMNNDSLASVFKTEGFKDMFLQNRNSAKLEKYLQDNDIFNVKNIKSDSLNRFLWSGFTTGKIDLRMQQLQDLAKLKPEEFNELFDIEDTQENRESTKATVEHIIQRAAEFEKTFEKESQRFSSLEKQAILQFTGAKKTIQDYEGQLKLKYNIDNIADLHKDVIDEGTALVEKYARSKNQIDRESILKDLDDHAEKNADKFKEIDTLNSLRRDVNDAYINHVALQEGKKATVFAFEDMRDSAQRAKEISKDLRENSHGLNFSELDNLLDKNSVEELRQRLITFHKSLAHPVTKEQVQERESLAERITLLEKIRDEYKREGKTNNSNVATHIQNFILADPFTKSNPAFKNWDYTGKKAVQHYRGIKELVDLQKRHQDNLNLYNRLSTSELFDEFAKYESKIVKDFIQRAADYHIKRSEEEQKAAEVVPEEQEAEVISSEIGETKEEEQPEVPKEEKKEGPKPAPVITGQEQGAQGDGTNIQAQAVLTAMKEKLGRGEALTDDDLAQLDALSVLDPQVEEFYNSYIEGLKNKLGIADYVEYKGKEYQISDLVTDPATNKESAILDELPGVIIPLTELQPVALEEKDERQETVDTGYIPENPQGDKLEQKMEEEQLRLHDGRVRASNRTIAQEKERKDDTSNEPKLRGGYTQFRQGFLDRMNQDSLIGNFTGYLTVDSKDNYPVDSEEYKYLEKNPNAAGLVLVITDKSGNDRFSNNYVASTNPKNNRLVFPLTTTDEKQELLALAKTIPNFKHPVTLDRVSKGAFDQIEDNTPLRTTEEFVQGASPNDYSFYIAKGHYRDIIFPVEGTELRNGGFYLRTKGSFIKLLPNFVADIEIGELKSPDIYNTIDTEFKTREEAGELASFLETMFYTVPKKSKDGKGGLNFAVYKNKKGRYQVFARIVGDNQVKNSNQEQVKQNMADQRMNINKNKFGQDIKFFYMENGKLTSTKVNYNELLLKNTKTNKKSYKLGDKKVIKPINRYLTFTEKLDEIKNTLSPTTRQVAAPEVVPQAPTQTTTSTTKEDIEKRRKEELLQESYRIEDRAEFYKDDEGRYFIVSYKKDGVGVSIIASDEDGKRYGEIANYKEGRTVPEMINNPTKINKEVGLKTDRVSEKIKAKYDAELASLEQTTAPQLKAFIKPYSAMNADVLREKLGITSEKNFYDWVDSFRNDTTGKKSIMLIDEASGKELKTQEDINTATDAKMVLVQDGKAVLRIPMSTNSSQKWADYNNYAQEVKQEAAPTIQPSVEQKEVENKEAEQRNAPKEEVKPTEESPNLTKPQEDITKPTPKTFKKRDRKDDSNKGPDDITKDLFRKKSEVLYSQAIQNPELQWVKDRFGEAVIKNLVDVAHANAWGQWTTAGITLYKDAPSGTGYHEAWHHFSQLYLTQDEKKDLYGSIRLDIPSLRGASDLEVEEYAAEKFREYAQADGKIDIPEVRRNIFQKIWDFIKRFFGRKDLNLNKLFSDLYKGNIAQYKPSINNAMFGKLNSAIKDENGNEIFDNRKSGRYLNYMHSLFGQFVAERGYSFGYFSIKENDLAKRVYKDAYKWMSDKIHEVQDELIDEENDYVAKYGNNSLRAETIADLDTILDNFTPIFNYYRDKGVVSSPSFTEEEIKDITAVDEELGSDDGVDNLEDVFEESGEAYNASDATDYNRAGNETSVIEAADDEVKLLIRTLSKVETDPRTGLPIMEDGQVKLAKNQFGLTEPVDFLQTINNISILLEGSATLGEMMDRMKNQDAQKKIPELALLLERMVDTTQDMKFPDVLNVVKFQTVFSKTFIPINSLVTLINKDKSKDVFFKEEVRRTKDVVEKMWSNNFQSLGEANTQVRSGWVLLDNNRRPYLNPRLAASLGQYDFSNQTQIDTFLKDILGINFSIGAKSSREYNNVVTVGDLVKLRDFVIKVLENDNKITNPVAEFKKRNYFGFKSGNKTIESEQRIINSFLELEAKYTNIAPSMSFRNAKGTLQHGLSLNMWLTMNNRKLSATKEYDEILQDPTAQHLNYNNNPYIKNSLFLERLFGEDGARRMINGEPIVVELGNYNGTKITDEKDNSKGKSTTDLSPRDKTIMDLNALLTSGAIEIMRTESSASAFYVRLSNYSTTDGISQNLPFPTEMLRGDVDHKLVTDRFIGYFEDEINMIINKFNSPLPNYSPSRKDIEAHYLGDAEGKKKLLTNPGRFSLFRGIISDKMQLDILARIMDFNEKNKTATPEEKQAETNAILKDYKFKVEAFVSKFLKGQMDELGQYINQQGITLQDISRKLHTAQNTKGNFSMNELIASFVVNNLVLNAEFAKLFSGNTSFYKAYHKRSKGDISTGKIPVTDAYFKSYLDTLHTSTMAHSYNVAPKDNLVTTRTLVLKDDERESAYTKDGKNSPYAKAILKLNPHLTEESVVSALKPYNGMTVADGQGQCTLDFYRQLRFSTGSWLYKDEIAYQKEVIQHRLDNNLYEAEHLKDQKESDEAFLERFKDVKSYFAPIKMQHNGPINVPGVFAPVLDKFSIAPLIPSVIKGSSWEKFHEELIKKGVGYTKFASGTKKYSFPAIDWKSKDWNVELGENNTYEVFTENLKEQIETKSKVKEESTWGTQMRKLFLANLFSSGFASSPKFADILERYVDLLDNVVNEEKKGLYKDFGITEDDNNINIKDAKRFVESLQRQVDLRQLNDNIKNSIGYDKETKSFTYPLEINLNKSAVQDLISGMIFKRLTNLKINGDMLIQIASTGYEKLGATKVGTDSDLRFYEPVYNESGDIVSTSAMEIKVSLTGDFKSLLHAIHPDGQEIGTLERLNALLKDKDWAEKNKKKITLIGYRIPTQGPNSMEFMQIAEFIGDIGGSTIILPPEIVAKSGSDYDIDKMNIFRPSLTAGGDLVDEDVLPELIKKGEDLEKQYQALRASGEYSSGDDSLDKFFDKLFGAEGNDNEESLDIVDNKIDSLEGRIKTIVEQYRDVANAKKKMFTNQVMDLYREVLSSPEMFTQLVTPNNTTLVKPVAEELSKLWGIEIGDYQDTDVYKYLSNLNKFNQLLSGKRDLGTYAIANTFSQLLQQAGMKLNTTYKLQRGIDTYKRILTTHLLNTEEKDSILQSTVKPDGSIIDQIDFSNNKNVEGQYKQEYFSQLINSTVDIASDPYYVALMSNSETMGAIVYLTNMGVPFRRAILFMGQPIIRRYVDTIKRRENEQYIRSTVTKELLGLPTGRKGAKAKVVNELIERIDTGRSKEEASKDAPAKDFFFGEDELVGQIERADKKALMENYKDSQYQRKVFAHFLKIKEQADAMRQLSTTMNFDTKKFISPVAVQANLNQREDARATELFDEAAVNRIYNRSMISAFNNLELNNRIFRSIMPVGMSDAIIKYSANRLSQYRKSSADKLKLERTLNNDWMEFVIKNFGGVSDENFEDYSKRLMVSEGAEPTLASELMRMKQLYPELEQFELYKRLFPNLSTKNPEIKNVELYRGLDNTSDFQNILIEEFEMLRDFKGDEIPGKDYTSDQINEIRSFFTDLQYLAFQQSGFNKGLLSMVDVVPYRELSDIFRRALDKYVEYIKNNPGAESDLVDKFGEMFDKNNPKFLDNEDREALQIPPTAEPWRGKFYKLNIGGNNNGNNGNNDIPLDPDMPSNTDLDDEINRCLGF